jgi:hypothetical protein
MVISILKCYFVYVYNLVFHSTTNDCHTVKEARLVADRATLVTTKWLRQLARLVSILQFALRF